MTNGITYSYIEYNSSRAKRGVSNFWYYDVRWVQLRATKSGPFAYSTIIKTLSIYIFENTKIAPIHILTSYFVGRFGPIKIVLPHNSLLKYMYHAMNCYVYVILGYRFCLFLRFFYLILELYRQCGILCFPFYSYTFRLKGQSNTKYALDRIIL